MSSRADESANRTMDSKENALLSSKPITLTRFRIIKNLLVISSTFVLLFTAYDGLSMLQSTMNKKQGIGSASQATIYLTFAISSLLLPKYTIKKIGCKMTLFVGSVLYWPYIAANAYPSWLTMIPSAVLIGIGAGILWASQCTYFNESAGMYCRAVDELKKKEKTLVTKSADVIFQICDIQTGVNEKTPSKPNLESKAIFVSQNKCEIIGNNDKTDCKCTSEKVVLEDSQCIKSKTQQCSDVDIEANKFNLSNVDPVSDLMSKSDEDTRDTTQDNLECKETINFKSEGSVLKNHNDGNLGLSSHLSIMQQIKSPIVEQVKEISKRTSSVSQSLKNFIIPETDLQHCNLESITARFFGCFGTMYYTAQVWSNLISFYALNSNNVEQNVTFTNRSCGASYCNIEMELADEVPDEIPTSNRYFLIGITLILSVVSSLLVLFFLDPLDSGRNEEKVSFSLNNFMATFNQLKKKEQLLLIPLSTFSGLNQGFYTADFTKSYIVCAWSISHVGLVTVFFGVACGISSTLSGLVVKYVGRIPVVLFGLMLHLGIDVFLLTWSPNAEQHFMFYMAAAVWGAKVGVIWSQIQAFYGLLFKNDEEAAFATHYFCSAIGWTLSFGYSEYLCTATKIYILMVSSCIGVIGYLLADKSYRRRQKT